MAFRLSVVVVVFRYNYFLLTEKSFFESKRNSSTQTNVFIAIPLKKNFFMVFYLRIKEIKVKSNSTYVM